MHFIGSAKNYTGNSKLIPRNYVIAFVHAKKNPALSQMLLADSLQADENHSCQLLIISSVKTVKPCRLHLKRTTLPFDASAINCTVYLSTFEVDKKFQRPALPLKRPPVQVRNSFPYFSQDLSRFPFPSCRFVLIGQAISFVFRTSVLYIYITVLGNFSVKLREGKHYSLNDQEEMIIQSVPIFSHN